MLAAAQFAFVGAEGGADCVPDAVIWDEIDIGAPGTSSSNAALTVSGTNTTGRMKVSWSGSGLTMSVGGTGGDGAILNGGTQTFEPGETLGFTATRVLDGGNLVTIEYETVFGGGSYATWNTFNVTRS